MDGGERGARGVRETSLVAPGTWTPRATKDIDFLLVLYGIVLYPGSNDRNSRWRSRQYKYWQTILKRPVRKVYSWSGVAELCALCLLARMARNGKGRGYQLAIGGKIAGM